MVYLALLGQLVAALQCRVHAYCLMTNHVHLLATVPATASCAALMKALSQRYAQYFNKKYQRTGTLWEGRYRSCVVESATYVLACYRYIELNPVRAGIADRADQYSWSSCEGNFGVRADPLITPHPEFQAIGPAAYAKLLCDGLDDAVVGELRAATQGGYPFGSDAFKELLSAQTGRKSKRSLPGPRSNRKSAEPGSVPDPDLFGEIGA